MLPLLRYRCRVVYDQSVTTRQQTVVELTGRVKIQFALRFAISADISGVNNVYGLLRRSVDRHIVIRTDSASPNNRSRMGAISGGKVMTSLRLAIEATKQGVSISEIVRQRLAS